MCVPHRRAACPHAAAPARPLRGRVNQEIDPYKSPPHRKGGNWPSVPQRRFAEGLWKYTAPGLPLRGAGARSATERCDRSALCGKLVEIAAAPTPHQQSWMENSTRQGARTPGQGRQFKNSSIRHGFAMPPPLKGRLWVDQEIDPYKVHSNASISFHRGCLWFAHNILYLSL